MIPYDREHRPGQAVKERSRLLKLSGPRPLREISGDDHEIGFLGSDVGEQRFGQILLMGTEMDVRHVDNDRHPFTIAGRPS